MELTSVNTCTANNYWQIVARRSTSCILLVLQLVTSSNLAAQSSDAALRLNEIQVIGTHNSYHVQPHESLMSLIRTTSSEQALAIEYSHRPLAEQFTKLGIRQIELDVWADPLGGHYAHPMGPKLLAEAGLEPMPAGRLSPAMMQPGLKVLHVPVFVYATTIETFRLALEQVNDWSQLHPRHVPIMILVEAKDSHVSPIFPRPKPFDVEALSAVDKTIRDVFSASQLITPDDVRGTASTLRDAVTQTGWPTLEQSRGKIIFALDNEGALRDAYLKDHDCLQDRVLFVSVDAEHPAAAFMKINDPEENFSRIQQFVERGFIVRTRADADTRQARENDTTRRDRALASGAQYVSTDYPEPNTLLSDYSVKLPGNVTVRPNPVIGSGVIAED